MTGAASLHVVPADPTPPYEQLRRQFVELIQAGGLAPGDRLPPVRQLASDLGLAIGTVARTYRELEAAGLVSTRRGAGTRVQQGKVERSRADLEQALHDRAIAFVQQARLLGASNKEIRAAVAGALRTAAS